MSDIIPAVHNLTFTRGITFLAKHFDAYSTVAGAEAEDSDLLVDISGWTPQAKVRAALDEDSPTLFDLSPSNAGSGRTTIEFTDEQVTTLLTGVADGLYYWDLVFINGSGQRIGPYVVGRVLVKTNATLAA